MRTRNRLIAAIAMSLAVASATVAIPVAAGAAAPNAPLTLSGPGFHPHSSAAGESDVNVCSDNVPAGVARCMARVTTSTGISPMAVGTPSGYSPAYLQSAYNVPAETLGAGKTIAIVDAYDNPTAEADLAAYRSYYGLPACTTDNGCFSKVDQNGGTNYPAYNSGWAMEIALDIQMVSAICPNCNILLVEATNPSLDNLLAAEQEAIVEGAAAISNSWGTTEGGYSWTDLDGIFESAGIPITASSGDGGYEVNWPALSPDVISVGGTTLNQTTATGTRNATETAWSGAGSGCSAYAPKPEWQADSTCTKRMVTDVSAVADPATGVAVYRGGSWYKVGGTSASAPIIAAMYGLAAPSANPAQDLYDHTEDLNDITSGSNGSCGGTYYCTAVAGYDGPTGLGTPNGIGAFGGEPVGPSNTTPPAISGALAPGETLTADPGVWDGTPEIAYSYQWQRCDAEGADCSDVEDAADAEYVVGQADVGNTLRVTVTATNDVDSDTASSDPTDVIVHAIIPENTSPPTTGGNLATNEVTLASEGTWSGSAETSHAYQWQRCDGFGNNCVDIADATHDRYTYGEGDLGSTLRMEVTKTNDAGSASAFSSAVALLGLAPVNSATPTIAGSALEGRTLTASKGTWSGSPTITYAYQWQRCTTSCSNIASATKSTYVVSSADVGKYLRVRVRATNDVTHNDAFAAKTAKVAKAKPLAVGKPTVSGTAKRSATLTASSGNWRGTATITVTGFRWLRCNSAGTSCVGITNATKRTYVVAAADKGHRLVVRVYVKNGVGTASADSSATAAAK
jgi:hypothetical protein